MTRLQEHYKAVVKPELISSFGYKNPMEVPKFEKVIINMGVGEAAADSKKIDSAANEMALISGQKPVIIKSRKSVATFKLREGIYKYKGSHIGPSPLGESALRRIKK